MKDSRTDESAGRVSRAKCGRSGGAVGSDRTAAPPRASSAATEHIGGCVCPVCKAWYPPGWNLHPNVRRDLFPWSVTK